MTIHDGQLQEKFSANLRNIAKKRFFVVFVIVNIVTLLQILTMLTEIKENLYFLVIYGQVAIVASILFILSKCCDKILEFFTLVNMVLRLLLFFILHQQKSAKSRGFEDLDLKQFQVMLTYLFFSSLGLFTLNMKVDLLLTVPLVVGGIYWAEGLSYSDEVGNASCQVQGGERIARTQFVSFLVCLLVFVWAIHDSRKT